MQRAKKIDVIRSFVLARGEFSVYCHVLQTPVFADESIL